MTFVFFRESFPRRAITESLWCILQDAGGKHRPTYKNICANAKNPKKTE